MKEGDRERKKERKRKENEKESERQREKREREREENGISLFHMSSLSSLQINKPIHEYGTTPLMFASQVGADRRIIEILIKEGGEVGRKDNDHWTALHYAANWNHLHAVEILLSRGSEVNPRDDYGRTPLHRACYWGYLHTVDLLLGHNGIDANVVDNDGDTPLHKAVRRRKYKWWCVRC
ncbi:ankyrin repeat, PH and SEC7 domain containing protein secG-like isoform X1 [Octopus sinensis]|uniref:Ankyrin repeat, PH and SEC7 domain containing protein secG-like isoform X1 n=1 Tax=Octopus sinensis TaxID=2607531 RepID=A0A7E6EKM9_9MOLL|nr:ankyrin repeat, PH and SEC7 domain containing protein secG-like isoform X1 [Octopus sinensis]